MLGTIAADVAGVSVAAELLTGISWLWLVLPLCAAILYVVVYRNFRTIQKALLYLSFILLVYVLAGFLARPDWSAVLAATFVPRVDFSLPFLTAALALLGTTITPYLFFWQTATEIEAKRTEKQKSRVSFDIVAGMLYSNLISFFIIVSTGALLYPRVQQLGGLANAPDPVRFIALALHPVAGDYSFYLFAVGLFAASVLAIVVLASSTAYVVTETLKWRSGLSKRVNQAKGFYAVLVGSVLLGAVILFAGVKPFDAMYYSQVLAGLADPILLVFAVQLASNQSLMGDAKLSTAWKLVAWFTIAVITLFALFFLRGLLGI